MQVGVDALIFKLACLIRPSSGNDHGVRPNRQNLGYLGVSDVPRSKRQDANSPGAPRHQCGRGFKQRPGILTGHESESEHRQRPGIADGSRKLRHI